MRGLTFERYSHITSRRRITRQQTPPDIAGDDEPVVETAGASNKLRLIVIAIVLIVILGVSATIFLSNPTPTGLVVGPASGKVTEANSSDLALFILLTVHNTTDKNMTYFYAQWNLLDDGTDADSGVWNDHIVLAPGEQRVLNESVDINLGDAVDLNVVSTAATWRLTGTATIAISGNNSTQNFDLNFDTQ